MYRGYKITANSNFTGFCSDGRRTPEEIFEHFAKTGLDGTDFDTEYFAGKADFESEAIRIGELAAKYGLDVSFGHLPFHKKLAARPDGKEDDEAFRRLMLDAIKAASLMGIRRGVVHPIQIKSNPGDLDANFRLNSEWFAPLLEQAANCNLELLIENMPSYSTEGPCRYGSKADHIIALADAFGCGNCWDTGHANINGDDQAAEIIKLGSRLKGLHLNDNVTKIDAHLIPFFGTADWKGVMRGLKEIGYGYTFNFECRTRHMPKAATGYVARHLLEVAHALIDMDTDV